MTDGTATEAAAVLRRHVNELEAEIERMTPKFVTYEYLVSPAGEKTALEENARLRARVTDAAAGEGWLPIETAPKDGTPIIAYNTRNTGHHPVVVRWKHERPGSEVGPEPHWADAATFLGDALYYNELFFDLWRPLPLPPSQDRTRAKP